MALMRWCNAVAACSDKQEHVEEWKSIVAMGALPTPDEARGARPSFGFSDDDDEFDPYVATEEAVGLGPDDD